MKRRKTGTSVFQSITEKYDVKGVIGEGTYGLVWFATSKSSNHVSNVKQMKHSSSESTSKSTKEYAIKYVKPHSEGQNLIILSMSTLREIKLLRELDHPHIVKLTDVILNCTDLGKELALVFDYAEHDLAKVLHQTRPKPLLEFTRKSLLWQILNGIKYLHDNWIIHRDLKPLNILVTKTGVVKIADFGLARIFQSPPRALGHVEKVVVTLWYRAPELLLGAKHYTKVVDIWAIGCIFAEMIKMEELFKGSEVEGPQAPFQEDQCAKIFKILGLPNDETWPHVKALPEYEKCQALATKEKFPQNSVLDKVIPKQGRERTADEQASFYLLERMLELNPANRITADDALNYEHYFGKREECPKLLAEAFKPPNLPNLIFKPHQATIVGKEDKMPDRIQETLAKKAKEKREDRRDESNRQRRKIEVVGVETVRRPSGQQGRAQSQAYLNYNNNRRGGAPNSRSHRGHRGQTQQRGQHHQQYNALSQAQGHGNRK